MEDHDEIIGEFLIESYESLDRLDRDLVELEDAPNDLECLASIFRTVHTIKGTAGFLAFPKLEKVAHVGENLLVPLRDGDLDLSRDMADGLLSMVDAIRDILGNIESEGAEGDQEFDELVDKLGVLKSGSAPTVDAPTTNQPTSDSPTNSPTATTENTPTENTPLDSEASDATAAEETKVDNTATTSPDAKGQQNQPVTPNAVDAPDQSAASKPTNPVASTPKNDLTAKSSSTTNGQTSERTSVADSSVRINVELLDKLMNLVGELVLCRNQILQFSETVEDSAMIASSQRLNLITTELQEGVMKTRMQPIRNAWSKLPRVVRDLSQSCGKEVEVRMEGADTELDKTILEALKDPLTHIVRNSVDHGIETAEVRAAAGKPSKGVLYMRAFHEGGQVNIEIADDGGGIQAERVRDKAIEKGLITADQADQMSERELTNLILLPGFSTAAQVTNVSGRGVGMDVVKTNIERIGGTIDIQSVPGEGTTLRIKIPLTLAIVPALIVKTLGDQYAIPQVSLLELVRLDGERATDQIEYIHDTPVYRLRGNLLPLIYLDEQLELRERRGADEPFDTINIVVLQADDQPFGLVVDDIADTQEIVVKPLGQHLKSISSYAGATIMGDGTVALILDVLGLAQKSSVLAEHQDRKTHVDRVEFSGSTADEEAILVVDPGDQSRAAVLLSTVARLEEFDLNDIERSGANDVIQYRESIMPLIYLNGSPPCGSEGSNRVSTIVYPNGVQSVGIVVGKVLDIVNQRLSRGPNGAIERCIVQNHVTEVIDLNSIVGSRYPELMSTTATSFETVS